MRLLLIGIFLMSIIFAGCETVREGAQEVGKPIGGTMKAMGGITEGAAEGYGDSESANPYNR
ncbi:MAG: hypothetical protein JW867_05990 [Candidatus Omnitrophica bacterium]|nr:hypothetical protein [Candidatus Omnitrophota bacterium]